MVNTLFSFLYDFFIFSLILEDQNDEEIQEIPLPNVKTHILAKVIEFAEHYKVEPMTEIAKVKKEYLFFPEFSIFQKKNILF